MSCTRSETLNPQATGGGDTLRAAGVQVAQGLLADEAEAGNAAWLTSVRLVRPYVLWKYAATLDGRIAAADRTSRWITSPEARADVHRLRAEADAVLVGSGTARTDDPQLGVRGIDGATQPLRIVVDTNATAVQPGARVLDATAPTLVAVAEDAPAGHLPEGAVLRLPRPPPAPASISTPSSKPCTPGASAPSSSKAAPTLAGAFVAAGKVDKVVGYLAPVLLGAGPAALADAGISTISQALRLDVTETVPIGPDLRVTAVPAPARKGN